MSSTYSPILRSELIGAGDQAGTWGNTTNSNFQYIFETAIAGYVAVTVSPTANNQVLTYVNGPSASAALDQSVYAMLKLNAGSLGANFNLFAPPVSKTYVVWNNTAYSATFYNSTVIGNTTPAGSGAVVPAGAKILIWSDGTSFYGIDTALGNFSIAGNLAVTGTTALTGNLTGSTATFSGAISSVSPSFTGVPTAPTAAGGTNTTQIATTGFVTSVINTLGTMATQDANAVAITGGAINGTTVGATTAASVRGTTGTFTGALSATTGTFSGAVSGTTGTFSGAVSGLSFAGAGTGLTGTAASLSIGGNAATATNAVTVTGATQNNITSIPNLATVGTIGSGTWNATLGAVSGANLTNLNASNLASGTVPSARLTGTYAISVSGNAATVTNGVYNNGGTYSINVTGNSGYATTAGNANAVFGKTKLGLGITGETWNYPGRAFNTTYSNPYTYPIAVSATATCAVTSTIYAYVNGNLVSWFQWQFNGCGSFGGAFIIVPPGATYQLNSSQGVQNWTELY